MTVDLSSLLARQFIVSGLVLGLAYALLAGKRGSAASRHRALLTALVSVLLISLFHAALPSWGPSVGQGFPETSVNSAPGGGAPSFLGIATRSLGGEAPSPWPNELSKAGGRLWVGLASLALLFLATVHLRHHILRQSLSRPHGIAQVEFDRACRQLGMCCRPRIGVGAVRTPMTLGIVRATVVLPLQSVEWAAPRLRAVLLHELVHVRRRDVLSRWLARAAWVVNIAQPLAWWAVRQLEIEQECATDDVVLAQGESPAGYAQHLLDTVVECRGRRQGGLAAHAASSTAIGLRIERILGSSKRSSGRGVPGPRWVLLASTLVLSSFGAGVEPRGEDSSPALGGEYEARGVDRPGGLIFDGNGRLLGARQADDTPLLAWMGSDWAIASEGTVELREDGSVDLGASGYLLVEVVRGGEPERLEARGGEVCRFDLDGNPIHPGAGAAWLVNHLPGVLKAAPLEDGRLRGSPVP